LNSFLAPVDKKKESAVIHLPETEKSTGYTSTDNWVDKIYDFCPPQVIQSSGMFDMHSFPSVFLLNETYQAKYKTHENQHYLAEVIRIREEVEKESGNQEKENKSYEPINVPISSEPYLSGKNAAYEEMFLSEINHMKGKSIQQFS